MRYTADYWMHHLQLAPHPEGGAFRQTYVAPLTLRREALPATFSGDRAAATHIYFLLRNGDYSAFHRLAADEIWHFYSGDNVLIHEIREDGALHTHRLGAAPEAGADFHAVVTAGSWFGAEVAPGGAYALVGCTMAPGFDFADFELAHRGSLARRFPEHLELIARLTPAPAT
ncbi:cupin domain-containing protein [Pendulispora albinea]|uniref:Cupin domain-containing protein n=1 Tax=Pendulispora albinea TaxID=2741071 RepID=A0ABZ2M9P3_9BACT